MKHPWFKHVFPIAALFSFRMLGLFMLIPVFTLYAEHLTGATPTLIGIALGSYGLSQGILQMPYGLWSDRFGRKTMITIGLILFAIGSLLGALSHSIYGIIAARILQGMGAIGSVLIALLADLTPDTERTKGMAVIGATIGVSFMLSMIMSPAIAHQWGLSGIFYITAMLAIAGLFILHCLIPTPEKEPFHPESETNPALLKQVLSNRHLLRLNTGIFCQHFILTATFFIVPQLLQNNITTGHLTAAWHFYLPLLLFAFLLMVPFIIFAEKKQLIKPVFLMSVIAIATCQMLLVFYAENWVSFCILMLIYFVGFNILEASLPSLISKQANPESKGTAMGVYSSCQFLGIFAGGVMAGVTYPLGGMTLLFAANAMVGWIWFFTAFSMQPNVYQTTLMVQIPPNMTSYTEMKAQLAALPGVCHVVFAEEQGVIYLRVNRAAYQSGSAEALILA